MVLDITNLGTGRATGNASESGSAGRGTVGAVAAEPGQALRLPAQPQPVGRGTVTVRAAAAEVRA